MREVAMSRSFVLVEELAETLTDALLLEFSLSSGVHLTIEKFVLPGVEWVGVDIHRSRQRESPAGA